MRRSRLRRRAYLGHECRCRRTIGLRHPPHRHAGHAVPGLAGDPVSRQRSLGSKMTQTVDLPLPSERTAETKLVGSVCFAHFVSHYYIMLLAPLFLIIREDYGVSYTELGLALTVSNVVSTVFQTPAGFLVDRMSARVVLIA